MLPRCVNDFVDGVGMLIDRLGVEGNERDSVDAIGKTQGPQYKGWSRRRFICRARKAGFVQNTGKFLVSAEAGVVNRAGVRCA